MWINVILLPLPNSLLPLPNSFLPLPNRPHEVLICFLPCLLIFLSTAQYVLYTKYYWTGLLYISMVRLGILAIGYFFGYFKKNFGYFWLLLGISPATWLCLHLSSLKLATDVWGGGPMKYQWTAELTNETRIGLNTFHSNERGDEQVDTGGFTDNENGNGRWDTIQNG